MTRLPTAVGTAAGIASLWALAIGYATRTPAILDASAPPTAFSAERAMRHVQALAQRPHPSGSEEHARVRGYLVDQLTALGLTPEIQETTAVGTRYAQSGRVKNVLVRVAGRQPGGPAVLLMSHYDGVPAGPAAGDAGAGSAALLETLRALRSGPPLTHDVIALFTDAEEAGLLGAAAFVREHRWARDAAVILNFEARGVSGPSLMFETGSGNLDVAKVLGTVDRVRATSLSTTVYRKLPNDTDLSEMALLGRPAMNFAFIGGAKRYHTAQDDVAHLSAASVQHHGHQALALARAFGNGPLPRPQTSDAVFFDFPLIGLIAYRESLAFPLSLLAAGIGVAVLVVLRRREPRWMRGAALGVVGLLASAVIAALIAVAIAFALKRLHADVGGSPEWSGLYAASVALLAIAVAAGVYALLRRWASATMAQLGALIAWAVLSLYVALAAPGASFLFTWPALFVAVAMLVSALSPPAVRHVVLWAGTAVALFMIVPIAYLMVCQALGLAETGAAIVAIFAALLTWLLAPHLESLAAGRLWLAPTIAAAFSAAMFIAGALTVRTTVNSPEGASLVYAVDADSGTTWLTGYGTGAHSRRWLRGVLDASKQPDGDRAPLWLIRRYGQGSVRAIAPPPSTPLSAPSVFIAGDSASTDGRRVTLRIHPVPGTLGITMDADSGTIVAAEIDGIPVDSKRYRSRLRRWRLDYTAPSTNGFTLTLTLAPESHPVVGIMGRSSGIPLTVTARPPDIVAVGAGDISLVYRRLRL